MEKNEKIEDAPSIVSMDQMNIEQIGKKDVPKEETLSLIEEFSRREDVELKGKMIVSSCHSYMIFPKTTKMPTPGLQKIVKSSIKWKDATFAFLKGEGDDPDCHLISTMDGHEAKLKSSFVDVFIGLFGKNFTVYGTDRREYPIVIRSTKTTYWFLVCPYGKGQVTEDVPAPEPVREHSVVSHSYSANDFRETISRHDALGTQIEEMKKSIEKKVSQMTEKEVQKNEGTAQLTAVVQRIENIFDIFSREFVIYAMAPEINYALDHTFGFMENMPNGDIMNFLLKADSLEWRPVNHPLWKEFCKGAENKGLQVESCYNFLIEMIKQNFGIINETSLKENIERKKNRLIDVIIRVRNLPPNSWRI